MLPWPRTWKGRVVGARRPKDPWEVRGSRYVVVPDALAVLTAVKSDGVALPLIGIRTLSPLLVEETGQEIVLVRWWLGPSVDASPAREASICLMVGPIAESPANFHGRTLVQVQRAPLCPCQRHSVSRRQKNICVCVVKQERPL